MNRLGVVAADGESLSFEMQAAYGNTSITPSRCVGSDVEDYTLWRGR